MELIIVTILIFQMGFGFFSVIRAVENNTEKVKKKIEENSRKENEYSKLKEAFDVLSIKTTELEIREKDILAHNEELYNKSKYVAKLTNEKNQMQNSILEIEEEKQGLYGVIDVLKFDKRHLTTEVGNLKKSLNDAQETNLQHLQQPLARNGSSKSFFKKRK